MAHWINEKFDLQNQVLGCWLHAGDSDLYTLQDNFLEYLCNRCKFPRAEIVAVMSNTTSNMNKFGTLLEKLDIPYIYCTDHVLQLTDKNSYLDSCYNEAFSGVENDSEDLNLDEFMELSTMAKLQSLVGYFSRSNQVLDNLIQQQARIQSYSSCWRFHLLVVNFLSVWEAGLSKTSLTSYGIGWSDLFEEVIDRRWLVSDWTGTQGLETIQVSHDSPGGQELRNRLIYSNSNKGHVYQTQGCE